LNRWRLPLTLRRHLQDIPEGSLRDRIIAKLALVSQLLHQAPKGADKIYSLHEPEVDCISKGKAKVRLMNSAARSAFPGGFN
jgi:IS5 family transposase